MGNWMLHGETIMPYDKSPLHVAVEAGDVESTRVLVQAGERGTACGAAQRGGGSAATCGGGQRKWLPEPAPSHI